LPEDLDDAKLEELLYPSSEGAEGSSGRPLPDWAAIHREYRRKGVTLNLLWQEYKAVHPDGYQYTQFCELYKNWTGRIEPVMRQRHKAGERQFVDYAGQRIPVKEGRSGGVREAELFLSVLGASNYTYAEATWTQTLPDWIGSHVNAFEYYGGVTEILVPDNLLSGVKHACRYEPEINRTYAEMAAHYNVSVIPARSKKPRDKAKVETGVLIAERAILAPLRNREFFDLRELNECIREELHRLNNRPFQNLPGCRRSVFEEVERKALMPLPESRYEFAEWRKEKVKPDYHVEVEGHYYSVPHRLVGHKIDIRYTAGTVECFQQGRRVASHPRSRLQGECTTTKEHMPASHRFYLEMTPEKAVERAERIGADVASLVKGILEKRQHSQIGLRSCLGILRLAKEYGEERLGCACRRAMAMQALSYKSVESILKAGLDRAGLPERVSQGHPVEHENLRGSQYFH
jgi:transposase